MHTVDQIHDALDAMKIGLGRLEIAATRVERGLRSGAKAQSADQTERQWRHDVTEQLATAIAQIDDLLR